MTKYLVWSTCFLLLLAAASPALMQSTADAIPAEIVALGQARHPITGKYAYGQFGYGTCEVPYEAVVIAVARAALGGEALIYTPACAAPIWISARQITGDVTWEDPAQLDTLAVITPPSAPAVLDYSAYRSFCEGELVEGAPPEGDGPHLITAFNPGSLGLPALLATDEAELAIVACITDPYQDVGMCSYTDGQDTYDLPQRRNDKRVRLVNYATGELFAEAYFEGSVRACPATTTLSTGATIYGEEPPTAVWVGWIAQQALGLEAAELTPRTSVSVELATAYAEPDTTAAGVAELPQATPLLPLARTEAGDWLVGLLPDGQQGWMPVAQVQIATRTDFAALPVVAAIPAADVPLWLPAAE